MNLGFLSLLVKGKNSLETAAKVLTVSGGIIAGLDANDDGADDLGAGICVAVANGLEKFSGGKSNEHGNIVDATIESLQTYRAEMVRCGKIPA